MGRVTGSQEMSPCRESLVRITQILMEALTAAGAGPPVEHEGRLRAPHPSVGTARPLETGEECARLCQDGAPPFLESEILSGEVRHDVANDVTSCNPPRVPPVGPSNSGHRPRPPGSPVTVGCSSAGPLWGPGVWRHRPSPGALLTLKL